MRRCGRLPTKRAAANETGGLSAARIGLREGQRGLAAHHPEAVGAVHRPRTGGPERNLGLIAAAGADGVVHFPRTARDAAVAAAVAIAAGAAAAGGASLGTTR